MGQLTNWSCSLQGQYTNLGFLTIWAYQKIISGTKSSEIVLGHNSQKTNKQPQWQESMSQIGVKAICFILPSQPVQAGTEGREARSHLDMAENPSPRNTKSGREQRVCDGEVSPLRNVPSWLSVWRHRRQRRGCFSQLLKNQIFMALGANQ